MHTSIKFLCSDVLRTLGLIRELKAFKFEHAALVLDFKGSLSLGHTVLRMLMTALKFKLFIVHCIILTFEWSNCFELVVRNNTRLLYSWGKITQTNMLKRNIIFRPARLDYLLGGHLYE